MTFFYIYYIFLFPFFFFILDDILRLETPVHVLVGTPGRVCDLAERQIADLSQCNIISIDEADKLLDDFFLPTIEKILGTCCTEKQILLFSATFPQTVNIKAKKEERAREWQHCSFRSPFYFNVINIFNFFLHPLLLLYYYYNSNY